MAVCSQHLNILSICTGGAGLDLGVELAVPCARTVCMVEREAFAVSTLVSAMEKGLLHSAPIWSDARTFDGRAWRGAVDGLIGGIPCQPHSLAGRKQGSNDARDLWSTARRIIVQAGAWFVLIENVGGMLSAGSDEIAGAQRVFRDLHKLGFEIEAGLFTAAEVGASHQRERVFILAVADCHNQQRRRQHELDSGARERSRQQSDRDCDSVSGVSVADAYDEGPQGRRHRDNPIGWQGAQRHAGLGRGELVDRRSAVDLYEEFQRNGFMEYAQGDRWGEGWTEPEFRRRGHAVACSDDTMADTKGDDQRRKWVSRARDGGIETGRHRSLPIFPPGPQEIIAWRDILARSPELEPAFRRVADGLASRMDIGRVDRLRMLGNGVVPIQAAYALRTLVTRLAARGSAGAARLVRMMEAA